MPDFKYSLNHDDWKDEAAAAQLLDQFLAKTSSARATRNRRVHSSLEAPAEQESTPAQAMGATQAQAKVAALQDRVRAKVAAAAAATQG